MKNSLRYKLKIKRRYFQNYQRSEADAMILSNFLRAYSNYGSFFIYNSFGTEADTSAIISALLKMGKRVYLPRTEGENIVPVPYGELKEGAFGISEPIGQAYDGEIEVTVAPLLAVNPNGYRIGYGKGYYDRYFKSARTRRVGLGYAFQLEEFENDEWDEPLNEFVSEKGIYYFEKV